MGQFGHIIVTSNRWQLREPPVWSLRPIHMHCADGFGQCDTPHLESCNRVASETLLTLDTPICQLYLKIWTLLNVSRMSCNVLFRRYIHHLASYGFVNCREGFMIWVSFKKHFRHPVHATPCLWHFCVFLGAFHYIMQVYQFYGCPVHF